MFSKKYISAMISRVIARAIFPCDVEDELKDQFFDGQIAGYFVDVGANDPEKWSQSWKLEQRGWHGVLIEPQPKFVIMLREQRQAIVFDCVCSSPKNNGKTLNFQVSGLYSSLNLDFFVAGMHKEEIIEVSARTLDDILTEANAPTRIDLLAIDVESHEIEVLKGTTLTKWQPRLIVIEDLVLNTRLHWYLRLHGYKWIRRTGLNSWYVPEASSIHASVFGQWQFFRKYYLGTPFRHIRETKRKLREQLRKMLAHNSVS